MRYIRLLIEYAGTNYHGWQSQKSGGTIQDVLYDSLFSITGEQGKVIGASRTDAGVHALGQVAVFETRSQLSPPVFMRALNAKLPPDIRILAADETDRDFHPRYRAIHKSYFYLISNTARRSAFLSSYMWTTGAALDLARMREAAAFVLGQHDFSSFRASGCGAKTTTRTVSFLEIARSEEISFMTAIFEGNFIRISIEANAFLRHMVRNIVGTLVEVGRGKLSPESFRDILSSCDRTAAGPTAPAQGLFLDKITY